MNYKLYYSQAKNNFYIICKYYKDDLFHVIYCKESSPLFLECEISTYKKEREVKRMATRDGWILLGDL